MTYVYSKYGIFIIAIFIKELHLSLKLLCVLYGILLKGLMDRA